VPGATVLLQPDMAAAESLATGLKPRHITMLSIAGIIGAGLFVGSGRVVASAGPGAILAYALAGTLVVLIMRMLGEMAVASPDTGSFSTYADRAIGRWAGFTIGWLYWWFWVLVIPLEANVAGAILNAWMPAVPMWGWALAVTVALTLTNLFSVRNYGEFEFWFALIKVVAIVLFLGVGVAAILGVLPGSPISGVSRLTADGGFLPNGITTVLIAMLGTMFSFMGTEIVTIAASESERPAEQIVQATNSVIWRICLFYLGTIFVVTSLVSWRDPQLPVVGAYQRTLEVIGIGGAKTVMDLVILTAVASCLNSAIYTASRMLWSLAERGDAPPSWRRTTAAGTPRAAVLWSVLVGVLATVANYVVPDRVFAFLMNTSGAIALLVYFVIAWSQYRTRRALDASGARPLLRMWGFPWITLGAMAFIVVVLGVMLVHPAHRMEVVATALVACGVIGIARTRHGAPTTAPPSAAPPPVASR
jgi:GABA permease